MAKIILLGEPRALQRHRTAIFRGKQKQYDPQSKIKMITKNYMLIERQKGGWPYDGNNGTIGFDLTINYYFYRPPSMRSLSEEELNKIPHIQKPDKDNCEKYIFDCGNKILWHDDAEIYRTVSQKFWSKQPRTEIIWVGM